MPLGTEFSRALAEAFLSGGWTSEELTSRGYLVVRFGRYHKWYARFVKRILFTFPEPPSRRVLITFIENYCTEQEAWNKLSELPTPTLLTLPRPEMQPAAGLSSDITVPALTTTGDLCDWLGLTLGELGWFVDQFRADSQAQDGPLRHYRYRFLRKSSGRVRLLEIPKPRLKQIQRQILHGILDQIPPHPAAHAFRSGRSIATYVAPHARQKVILHVDLRDFFPSIRASRIHALFRTVGYPERVARWLTALCTHRTNASVLTDIAPEALDLRSRQMYLQRHLPQGAPTSPALANLSARRLDVRLSALAKRFDAAYTRYADDLLISGGTELQRGLTRFRISLFAIVLNEDFSIRTNKTRVLLNSQSQRVAGVVLNEHPNVPRHDFDHLKAILFNCVRHGAESQNRDRHANFSQHLQGRIAYLSMINPDRGIKLQQLFDRIQWPQALDNSRPSPPEPTARPAIAKTKPQT